jgi:hypothetical protein
MIPKRLRPLRLPRLLDVERDAGARRQAAHARNSTARLYDDPNHENTLGFAAECAWLMRFFKRAPEPWAGGAGDPGFDCEMFGIRIDLKGCHKTPWMIPVKERDLAKHAAHVYVLGHVKPTVVDFLAWTWGDYLREGEAWRGTVDAPARIVRLDDERHVSPIVDLFALMKPIDASAIRWELRR